MITVYALKVFKPHLQGVIRDIRATWTLEELGMPYERKVMDPTKGENATPEYLAINPFGKVPAIKDDDFVLFESAAICTYLAEKKGQLIPPSGTRERALYNQWVSYAVSTFEPMAARIFGLDHSGETKNPIVAGMRSDFVKSMYSYMTALNGILAKRQYIAGEDFSVADICLCGAARFVVHTELAAKHQHFDAYLKKCYARPAFKKVFDAQQ